MLPLFLCVRCLFPYKDLHMLKNRVCLTQYLLFLRLRFLDCRFFIFICKSPPDRTAEKCAGFILQNWTCLYNIDVAKWCTAGWGGRSINWYAFYLVVCFECVQCVCFLTTKIHALQSRCFDTCSHRACAIHLVLKRTFLVWPEKHVEHDGRQHHRPPTTKVLQRDALLDQLTVENIANHDDPQFDVEVQILQQHGIWKPSFVHVQQQCERRRRIANNKNSPRACK